MQCNPMKTTRNEQKYILSARARVQMYCQLQVSFSLLHENTYIYLSVLCKNRHNHIYVCVCNYAEK